MCCVCVGMQVNLLEMSERLLGLAVRRETVGRNRKLLYGLRQKLQDFDNQQQVETSDQSDEGIVSYYITVHCGTC